MKNMQLLMNSVDSLQQDTYRLLGYEKAVAKQIQTKQQFLLRRVRLLPWLYNPNSVCIMYILVKGALPVGESASIPANFLAYCSSL